MSSWNKKSTEIRVFQDANLLLQAFRTQLNGAENREILHLNVNYTPRIEITLSGLSFIIFRSYPGPLVALRLNCVNTQSNSAESNLTLTRINKLTYKVHIWFSMILITLLLLVAMYSIIKGHYIGVKMLVVSLFVIGYILLVESIAAIIAAKLIDKVEDILRLAQIKYEKL